MTAVNANDYLPAVEALRDGELESMTDNGWEPCDETAFVLPPDHYRRRPKLVEGFTLESAVFPTLEEATQFRKGFHSLPLTKIIHVREVLP